MWIPCLYKYVVFSLGRSVETGKNQASVQGAEPFWVLSAHTHLLDRIKEGPFLLLCFLRLGYRKGKC